MANFLFVKLAFLISVLTFIVRGESNDCSSNPCQTDQCEYCENNNPIRCVKAPCPQYECRTNQTCVDEMKKLPRTPFCSLPAETGHCKAYFQSYFFNVTTKRCENFIYGGCGGNKNRFKTKLECKRVCVLGEECPKRKLPKLDEGCRYDSEPDDNGCKKYEPVCDLKPGKCPTEWREAPNTACIMECSNDPSCQGDKKCCEIGCNQVCLPPANGTISNITSSN